MCIVYEKTAPDTTTCQRSLPPLSATLSNSHAIAVLLLPPVIGSRVMRTENLLFLQPQLGLSRQVLCDDVIVLSALGDQYTVHM